MARTSISSNAAGHDIVVSKKVHDVLALETPVQAEPWLIPRMAPSASGAKVSMNELSRSVRKRQIIGCQTSAFLIALDALVRATAPATCIR